MVEEASLSPSDGELARRVQEGDREAFELLARRYIRPIHAVVASFFQEKADVEDATQDAFLRALDRIHSYDPRRPFAPWLYQIARNVARNRLKSQKVRRWQPLSQVESWVRDGNPDPAVVLERAELKGLLAAEIDRLPERQRIAFRLFDVEGYPAAEVAELMGLSPSSARSNVHHARRALRRRLAHLLPGPGPE